MVGSDDRHGSRSYREPGCVRAMRWAIGSVVGVVATMTGSAWNLMANHGADITDPLWSRLVVQLGLPIAMLAVLARYHAHVTLTKDQEIARLNDKILLVSERSNERILRALAMTSSLAEQSNATIDQIVERGRKP